MRVPSTHVYGIPGNLTALTDACVIYNPTCDTRCSMPISYGASWRVLVVAAVVGGIAASALSSPTAGGEHEPKQMFLLCRLCCSAMAPYAGAVDFVCSQVAGLMSCTLGSISQCSLLDSDTGCQLAVNAVKHRYLWLLLERIVVYTTSGPY